MTILLVRMRTMKRDWEIIKKINKALKNDDQVELENAFNLIYEKYNRLVRYLAYKIVLNLEVAEDITQETFLRFFNHINKTKFYNLKYYLVTTAKNLSLNYRKKKLQETIYNDDLVLRVSNENKNRFTEMILDLQKFLSPEEVDIIIFRLVFNYSFKEIAKEMNTTLYTISSKYYRAIKKIKDFEKKE